MKESCRGYWNRFLATQDTVTQDDESYLTDEFGDNPELANELVGLILNGTKTASCSLLYEYERDGCPIPEEGDRKIVLNGQKEPVCIIEIKEVEIKPYGEVDEAFAYEEGEGDRTYEFWNREHRKYFMRVLAKEGKEFDDSMLLVCERFQVIHK